MAQTKKKTNPKASPIKETQLFQHTSFTIMSSKSKIFLVLALLPLSLRSQDFRLDNTNYQTVSWKEFFRRLEKNPKLVYFDIRTPGERSDTSQYLSVNQGKIRGALETDFFNFDSSYPAYLQHKADTIYLYCSHSRRSRLLAKRLADSSFHVVSINAGITYLNNHPDQFASERRKYYYNQLPYQLISPAQFANCLHQTSFQIIDVRPDSVFQGVSGIEWDNSFGHVDRSLHIPYDQLENNMKKLDRNKTVVLFDNDGELAPLAARYLVQKGFRAGVLLFGLDNLTSTLPESKRNFLKGGYRFITPTELLALSRQPNTIIVDVRTEAEFMSRDTAAWRNQGRLKGAINLPLSGLEKNRVNLLKGKNIVLYDIMMHDELYEFAKKLHSFGIHQFSLLSGGIFQFKWELYNLGKTELASLLIEAN